MKNRDINGRKKKIKEQLEVENKAKTDFEKLMKLKSKEYKRIPDKEKFAIKNHYLIEKKRREMMEENVEKIQKMTALEYLDILNKETKENLIGLCFNKNILNPLDETTNETDNEEEEVEREENEVEEEED